MLKGFTIVVGMLGLAGCHGDTHLSTDVNADLLRATDVAITHPVVIKGNVECTTCDSGYGMAIVVSSTLAANVANGLVNGVGNYSLNGVAMNGDTLKITVTVTQESGLVTKSATVPVPDGGGTITQDFQF